MYVHCTYCIDMKGVVQCTLHACLQDKTAQDFLSMVKSWQKYKMKKPGAYVRVEEEQVL